MSVKIDILTIFPNMFVGPFDESIIKRASTRNLAQISIHNLRDWGQGRHKVLDDRPYGGGVGMILMIEPIFNALQSLKTKDTLVIATQASGHRFTQQKAESLSKRSHLIILCGHYEGFDQRILDNLVDEEISIGDFVLTGGEIPAMAIVDTVVRLIPGTLDKPKAIESESFSKEFPLEYPHYTRPEVFRDWEVPKVLLSGDHKKIAEWKKEKSLKITKARRPDLL